MTDIERVIIRRKRGPVKTPTYLRILERQVAEDIQPRTGHPLELARLGTGPLEFAEMVLKHERLIEVRNGTEFVAGRCATPLLKVREANRALKRLGMPTIDGDPAWRV
jgi:hypothetical protein